MKNEATIVQEQFQGWNISVQQYSAAGYIPVVDNCFGFMFTNVGDTIATVNGMIIHPSATPATNLGDSRSVMAHKNDVYKGRILLSFAVPAGLIPLVEVIQIYYIKNKPLE